MIAPDPAVHPIRVSQWKKPLPEGASELREMVDHDHPELTVRSPCEWLGLPRSSPDHQLVPLRESMRRIMARIDACQLEALGGSRRLLRCVSKDGIPARERSQILPMRME